MVDQRVNRTLKVAAGMGKGRDKYIGHLAHGEVVLPIPFQKAYPGLIHDLKRAFERAGLDFNRYIVGHQHNRINDLTGIPMFEGEGDGGGDGGSDGGGAEGGNGGGAGMGAEGGTAAEGGAAGSSGMGAEGGTAAEGGVSGGASGGASSGAGMGPEGGDMGGYDSEGLGSIGEGFEGGGGDGGGDKSTQNQQETPKEPPRLNPVTPQLTPPNMTYAPLGPATFSPATPSNLPMGDFASGSTTFNGAQIPAFADGGIVDAALKKVSNKYSDTGLPLNAMQILSKIAKSG